MSSGKIQSRRARAKLRSLRLHLDHWDPLGVMTDPTGELWPRDTYDGMRDRVLINLLRGSDPETLACFLRRDLSIHYGVDEPIVPLEVVTQIFEWWSRVPLSDERPY